MVKSLLLAVPLLLLLLARGTNAAAAAVPLQLLPLDVYPNARCIDGSPFGFYQFPAETAAGENKWEFFIDGGGWCGTLDDCKQRVGTMLGTSTLWPNSSDAGIEQQNTGFLSRNCTLNPELCDFNLIWMIYCDGGSFTGQRETPINHKGTDLYFQGSFILDALLDYLVKNTAITNATDVLFTGGSAGGLSTFIHTERVYNTLQPKMPNLKRFRAVPMSGFFLNKNSLQDQPIFPAMLANYYQFANVSDSLPKTCREALKVAPEFAWTCMMAEVAFAHIPTDPQTGAAVVPTFVMNSVMDSFQINCILLTVVGVSGAGSEICNFEIPYPGYSSYCPTWEGKDEYSNHVLGNCSKAQAAPLLFYQDSYLNRVASVAGYSTPGNGAFLHSCFTHVEALSDSYYTTFASKNSNMTMQQAILSWWNSPAATPAEQNTHIGALRHHKAPFSSNPSCLDAN